MSGVELKGLKGLKGLNVLLDESKQTAVFQDSIVLLSTEVLVSGKYQPRKDFDNTSLQDLANSISSQGIIQPIIVRKITDTQYEIIAGERRWRAAKIAGLPLVPVIMRNITDDTALAFALIENIQREDLSPIEQAVALCQLKDEFLMTHEEVAKTVGYSRSAVTNLIRLLSLSSEVKVLLQQKKLEMGHARALLALDEEQQIIIARQIVQKKLNVRDTEKLVSITKAKSSKVLISQPNNLKALEKVQALEEELKKKFSTTVNIRFNKKGQGSIVINVDNWVEAEWLVKHIRLD